MPFLLGLVIIAAIAASRTDWDKEDAVGMFIGRIILAFIGGGIVCLIFFGLMRVMS